MKKINYGFTFIELLMALAIFSVIATSIYYTLHSGIELWSKGNSAISHNQKLRVFFNAVSSDLRNTVPCYGMEAITPEWSEEKISFPTLRGEIIEAVYYFDDKKNELKRTYARREEGFDEESADAETLLDGLEGAGFEYAYEADEGYTWKKTWESEDTAPRAVRFKCEFKERAVGGAESFEKIIFIPIGKLGEEE
jgi:prepilin-type N-terminal cleavage/methylation domain-containing protein